ncbi:hypothetical protein T310_0962 [Rasamsonia emersonii CBS 393.64]|uniref:Uncharacterized protein n=1 Tax=Rasamsonia emersonii (strain ATCC 16479 / CBS 393.64 / IMI 116815) TaxID=1408163 RepID=A0A0F4Z4F7_RASE3|nr:hypothetical protein T310_0962 [Rasamsonia emersonii CBS 393.64]KKA24981.1 hypothetical protein T310_0962 [Rasamsonia emersonii CBS 393.64]
MPGRAIEPMADVGPASMTQIHSEKKERTFARPTSSTEYTLHWRPPLRMGQECKDAAEYDGISCRRNPTLSSTGGVQPPTTSTPLPTPPSFDSSDQLTTLRIVIPSSKPSGQHSQSLKPKKNKFSHEFLKDGRSCGPTARLTGSDRMPGRLYLHTDVRSSSQNDSAPAVDPIDDNSDAACTSDEQIAPSVLNSQVTAAMEQLPRGPS